MTAPPIATLFYAADSDHSQRLLSLLGNCKALDARIHKVKVDGSMPHAPVRTVPTIRVQEPGGSQSTYVGKSAFDYIHHQLPTFQSTPLTGPLQVLAIVGVFIFLARPSTVVR
jgi:hypothetical protein